MPKRMDLVVLAIHYRHYKMFSTLMHGISLVSNVIKSCIHNLSLFPLSLFSMSSSVTRFVLNHCCHHFRHLLFVVFVSYLVPSVVVFNIIGCCIHVLNHWCLHFRHRVVLNFSFRSSFFSMFDEDGHNNRNKVSTMLG